MKTFTSLALLTFGASSAAAAVIEIDSITGSPSFGSPSTQVSNSTTLASITTSEGTFSDLVGVSQATGLDVSTYFYAGTDPGSAAAAIEGLLLTASTPNGSSTVRFAGGSGVGVSNTFFIFEVGGNDTITLAPVDSAGTAIGTYSLDITSWGPALMTVDNPINSNTGIPATSDFLLHGVTFTLGDFGGTGDLSDFSGFSISSGGSADPVLLGAVVPEPRTALLVGLGALGLVRRRRQSV